jgi:hypothetical protein
MSSTRQLNYSLLHCAASFALGGWLVFFALWSREDLSLTVQARDTLAGNSKCILSGPSYQASGPAGIIEAFEIPFANANGVFPDQSDRLQSEKWVFNGFSETSLASFLSSCDVRSAVKSMLLDRSKWTAKSNGCTITPGPQLIWDLGPRARQQIYSVLATNAQNYPQYYPWQFSPARLDEKFRASGVSGSTLEKFKHLTYTNDGSIYFADLNALHNTLSGEQFNLLIETLCAAPAFVLRLHVREGQCLEELVHYWGKGGREKLVAPILGSLLRVPGGGTINISYLLPPYARLHLYTYPNGWSDESAPLQDCAVAAANFFNDRPDPRLFERPYLENFIKTNYCPVNEAAFGDLVTLANTNGQIFHFCVSIVDQFVFTKNGVDFNQPWVIMRFSDMLATYAHIEKNPRVGILRRKPETVTTLAAR